jgi:hypothetical protein
VSTIAERVANGAKWLDSEAPGWWKAGRPHPMDLGILGLDYMKDADAYGFNSAVSDDEREALKAEWARVKAERRSAVTP